MNLTPVQQQIVDTPGNLIVRASAGTGKTHTMVAKIATEIEHNHTHKSIAAITFTIKAAQEIKDRLTIDSSRHFIGTNNSFVIEEIIKPFLKDVYGAEFEVDMSTDYSIRIDTFEAGLDKVKREQVLCSYTDSKKNFVFDLALDVIMKSSACRLYLQAKYFKIYIDEYQDCDKSMHMLFMYICDTLGIDTFVVGDEKQSIYIWRGAYPEAFKSIWNTLWDAANRYLHANLPKGTKTLPIAEWEQEYADLKTQRDSDYTKLKETRAEVAELQKIRRCVDIALRADQPEQTQSRTKRHEQER